MVNDTTRLLGLDGLVAERVELDATGVPVVDLSTGSVQARCCPQCGQRAVRVKQWTTTRPRDLPVAGRPVRLRWRTALVLPDCGLSAPVVHRAGRPGPGPLTADHPAAAGGRCRRRRLRPHDRAVRPGPRPRVAGCRGRVHRPRERGAAGRTGARRGARHRRGPPRQTALELGRAGRLVDHDRRSVPRRLRGSVRRPRGCSPRSKAAPPPRSPPG